VTTLDYSSSSWPNSGLNSPALTSTSNGDFYRSCPKTIVQSTRAFTTLIESCIMRVFAFDAMVYNLVRRGIALLSIHIIVVGDETFNPWQLKRAQLSSSTAVEIYVSVGI
jgi:hypothetical protein